MFIIKKSFEKNARTSEIYSILSYDWLVTDDENLFSSVQFDFFQSRKKFKRMPKKVLIIGAGIGGISAGRHLLDNSNLEVTVLEANFDRIGGRMRTYYPIEHPEKPIELGYNTEFNIKIIIE